MKQLRMMIIGIVVGALMATASTSFAASAIKKVSAALHPEYSVVVDGKKKELKNSIVNINGSAYVPLREIGEILSYNVGFANGVITLDAKEGANVENVTSEKWVSLQELVQLGVSVQLGPYAGLDNVLQLSANGTEIQILDFISPQNSEEATYVVMENGAIESYLLNGRTYLDKYRLIELGIMVQ